MQPIRTFAMLSALSIVAIASSLGGCEKKSEPTKAATSGATTSGVSPSGAAAPKDHDHKDGDGHDHGPTTQLGEQIAGGFTIRASRDGEIVPGKDAPIDVWVTGGTAKVAAVRFWIGTQDAKGSMKAKAELEKDNWHTHAEIPNPLPAGSMLWVEVESDGGSKAAAGFELKL
jgi:hypothetical protein